ncbi:hypothetical protein CHUBBYTHOR_8 [Shigella phage ChubbyThor]|nr:hypothetical protein CHUBBYTHOR_8 [Shigella phage ChubbyThor]
MRQVLQNSDHPDKRDHSSTKHRIVAINHILALVMSGVMFCRPASFGLNVRGQVLKCDEDTEVRVVW